MLARIVADDARGSVHGVAVLKNLVSGIDHRCVPIPIGTQIDEENAVLVNSNDIEGNSTMRSGLAR
jgi:hypothetical protein